MKDTRAGDGVAFFLLGAALGAAKVPRQGATRGALSVRAQTRRKASRSAQRLPATNRQMSGCTLARFTLQSRRR